MQMLLSKMHKCVGVIMDNTWNVTGDYCSNGGVLVTIVTLVEKSMRNFSCLYNYALTNKFFLFAYWSGLQEQ